MDEVEGFRTAFSEQAKDYEGPAIEARYDVMAHVVSATILDDAICATVLFTGTVTRPGLIATSKGHTQQVCVSATLERTPNE